MNRVLRVDMSTKNVKTELRDEYKFCGGRELVPLQPRGYPALATVPEWLEQGIFIDYSRIRG